MNLPIKRLLSASVLVLGLPLFGLAQADTAQDTLKRFVDGVQTFEAHFDQAVSNEKGVVTNRSSGQFALARPAAGGKGEVGRFRWAYEKPYEQISVCDGAKLWSYDPDLNQVTVRAAQTALAGTPAALLSQRSGLSDTFDVQDGGADGDQRTVRLVPKNKDSDFKTIELTLDKNGAPVRMRFADQIGGTSEVKFTAIQTNTKIDPARFTFTPPKGADIVDGDGGPTTRPLAN